MEAALRNSVWERAQAKCAYCRMPQHLDRLTFEVEHILPVKHGGAAALENLALACFFCNRYKGPNLAGIDSESGQVVTLFHPRREVWSEHFVWSEGTLKGLTPHARATIAVLRINDAARVALRNLLFASGDFLG